MATIYGPFARGITPAPVATPRASGGGSRPRAADPRAVGLPTGPAAADLAYYGPAAAPTQYRSQAPLSAAMTRGTRNSPAPATAPAAPAAAPAQAGGFGGIPTPAVFGGSSNPTAGWGGYAADYQSALNANKAMYQAIQQGYGQTMAAATSAQDAIAGGYAGLSTDIRSALQKSQTENANGYAALRDQVVGGLQGIGDANAQAIRDNYAQLQGAGQQSLMGRGLGNTTVLDSVNRGYAFDREKALAANQNEVARTIAGYRTQLGLADMGYRADAANRQADLAGQLGLAGLSYQGGAVRDNTALAQNQLSWMNSVQQPYPDANAYAAVAAQQAQAAQQAIENARYDRAEQFALAASRAGMTPSATPTTYGQGPTHGAGPSAGFAATEAYNAAVNAGMPQAVALGAYSSALTRAATAGAGAGGGGGGGSRAPVAPGGPSPYGNPYGGGFSSGGVYNPYGLSYGGSGASTSYYAGMAPAAPGYDANAGPYGNVYGGGFSGGTGGGYGGGYFIPDDYDFSGYGGEFGPSYY